MSKTDSQYAAPLTRASEQEAKRRILSDKRRRFLNEKELTENDKKAGYVSIQGENENSDGKTSKGQETVDVGLGTGLEGQKRDSGKGFNERATRSSTKRATRSSTKAEKVKHESGYVDPAPTRTRKGLPYEELLPVGKEAVYEEVPPYAEGPPKATVKKKAVYEEVPPKAGASNYQEPSVNKGTQYSNPNFNLSPSSSQPKSAISGSENRVMTNPAYSEPRLRQELQVDSLYQKLPGSDYQEPYQRDGGYMKIGSQKNKALSQGDSEESLQGDGEYLEILPSDPELQEGGQYSQILPSDPEYEKVIQALSQGVYARNAQQGLPRSSSEEGVYDRLSRPNLNDRRGVGNYAALRPVDGNRNRAYQQLVGGENLTGYGYFGGPVYEEVGPRNPNPPIYEEVEDSKEYPYASAKGFNDEDLEDWALTLRDAENRAKAMTSSQQAINPEFINPTVLNRQAADDELNKEAKPDLAINAINTEERDVEQFEQQEKQESQDPQNASANPEVLHETGYADLAPASQGSPYKGPLSVEEQQTSLTERNEELVLQQEDLRHQLEQMKGAANYDLPRGQGRGPVEYEDPFLPNVSESGRLVANGLYDEPHGVDPSHYQEVQAMDRSRYGNVFRHGSASSEMGLMDAGLENVYNTPNQAQRQKNAYEEVGASPRSQVADFSNTEPEYLDVSPSSLPVEQVQQTASSEISANRSQYNELARSNEALQQKRSELASQYSTLQSRAHPELSLYDFLRRTGRQQTGEVPSYYDYNSAWMQQSSIKPPYGSVNPSFTQYNEDSSGMYPQMEPHNGLERANAFYNPNYGTVKPREEAALHPSSHPSSVINGPETHPAASTATASTTTASAYPLKEAMRILAIKHLKLKPDLGKTEQDITNTAANTFIAACAKICTAIASSGRDIKDIWSGKQNFTLFLAEKKAFLYGVALLTGKDPAQLESVGWDSPLRKVDEKIFAEAIKDFKNNRSAISNIKDSFKDQKLQHKARVPSPSPSNVSYMSLDQRLNIIANR